MFRSLVIFYFLDSWSQAENRLVSYRKSRNIWDELRIWGLKGFWGVIFIVDIIKRIAPKLRRTILLHFGLVTFRFHFGETRKPIIFTVFGLGGRDHDSQNQYHLSLETPGYFK